MSSALGWANNTKRLTVMVGVDDSTLQATEGLKTTQGLFDSRTKHSMLKDYSIV